MNKVKVITLVFAGLIFILGHVNSQDFEYIGSNGCKACHSSSKKGAQYKVWAAGKHAQAFETLKSDAAAKIAKEKGIKVPAYEAPECLPCHTVGFGEGGYEVKDEKFWNPAEDDRAGKKAVRRMEGLKGVGCESCHGPGSKYKSKKIKEAVIAGTIKAESVGLIKPDEKSCLVCHNEKSPSFQPFDFKERVKDIAHPYPADMKK